MKAPHTSSFETAIRSLYQLILSVNKKTLECQVMDYNSDLHNISDKISSFDVFSDDLYANIHPGDRMNFSKFVDSDFFPSALNENVHTSIQCRIRHIDRQYYWSEIIFCNATNEDNIGGHDCLFLIRDIHDMKSKELLEDAKQRSLLLNLREEYNQLFETNMRDEQTGCYNRKGMKYYTDKILDEARKSGKLIFVCVADLNGLKHINDTYGHAAGDEAIAAVSKQFIDASPRGSRIVRTGGDEFLIMATLSANSREPSEMEEKIDQGLEAYNAAHSNQYKVGASFGWVLMPLKENMSDIDEYIAIADQKMYEMKKQRDKHRRD